MATMRNEWMGFWPPFWSSSSLVMECSRWSLRPSSGAYRRSGAYPGCALELARFEILSQHQDFSHKRRGVKETLLPISYFYRRRLECVKCGDGFITRRQFL